LGPQVSPSVLAPRATMLADRWLRAQFVREYLVVGKSEDNPACSLIEVKNAPFFGHVFGL